jgi:hypothetical protein
MNSELPDHTQFLAEESLSALIKRKLASPQETGELAREASRLLTEFMTHTQTEFPPAMLQSISLILEGCASYLAPTSGELRERTKLDTVPAPPLIPSDLTTSPEEPLDI